MQGRYLGEFVGSNLIVPLVVLVMRLVRRSTRRLRPILVGLAWAFLFSMTAQAGLLASAAETPYQPSDVLLSEFLKGCRGTCPATLAVCNAYCACASELAFAGDRLSVERLMRRSLLGQGVGQPTLSRIEDRCGRLER